MFTLKAILPDGRFPYRYAYCQWGPCLEVKLTKVYSTLQRDRNKNVKINTLDIL